MTAEEILKADLLDIVFDRRNKEYGAYALRKNYSQRLMQAMIWSFAICGLLVSVCFLKKQKNSFEKPGIENGGYKITEVVPPALILPPKPVVAPSHSIHNPFVEFTSQIEIKPDPLVRNPLPTIADLDGKSISTVSTPGDGPNILSERGNPTLAASTQSPVKPDISFEGNETQPEFPGGPEALRRFLSFNLATPSDLDGGDKKTVLVKFLVDKDGIVSAAEIVNSGGTEFDREVLRVCKKMPHWKPASQNGVRVPVSFLLPVTFVGVEQ